MFTNKKSKSSLGDWNISPDDVIYQYLTSGSINKADYPRFLTPLQHGSDSAANLVDIVNTSLTGEHEKAMASRKIESEKDQQRILKLEKIISEQSGTHLLESTHANYVNLANCKPNKYWPSEVPHTSVGLWVGTLDFIFTVKDAEKRICPKSRLTPTQILQIPPDDIVFESTALPNDYLPSDHIRIEAKFQLN